MGRVDAGEVQSAVRAFLSGCADSLSVHQSVIFFFTSTTVRTRMLSCLFLNGLIFVGSIYLHDLVVGPAVGMLLDAAGRGDPSLARLGGYVSGALAVLQLVLWTLPIYVISFAFNIVWYQDIADSAYLFCGGEPNRPPLTWRRVLKSLSEVLFRLLLTLAFLVQAYLCYLVPVVGQWLATLHFSWIYALQAFDYKWALEGWSMEKTLAYFERRFAYMAGFGFPCALITVAFPPFVSAGIYAFVFPVFIILAILAKPVAHVRGTDEYEAREALADAPVAARQPGRLPIFHFAKILNAAFVRRLYVSSVAGARAARAKAQ